MPLPEPETDESKDDFLDRCMGDDTMNEEYPDDDQRAAVCNTQWDDKDENSMKPNMERRVLPAGDVELRVDGKKPAHIIGYAARFNRDSLDLGFGGMKVIERIAPGAFKNALKTSDVRALKNHDPNLVLGREPNTLVLTENARGLKFNITAPDTTTGKDAAEEIRRGDITGSSFSFTVKSDTWEERDDGMYRTINEVGEVFDVGPVTFPAYPDTSVAARSLEKFKREATAHEKIAQGAGAPPIAADTAELTPGEVVEPDAEPERQPEPEPKPESATPILDDTRAQLAAAAEAEAEAAKVEVILKISRQRE